MTTVRIPLAYSGPGYATGELTITRHPFYCLRSDEVRVELDTLIKNKGYIVLSPKRVETWVRMAQNAIEPNVFNGYTERELLDIIDFAHEKGFRS